MNCKICDERIDFNFFNGEQLRERQFCFYCSFWWDYVEMRADGDTFMGNRIARILNNHYILMPYEQGKPLGFGGREFVIRFLDGTEVTTRNLWHQGEIPERFRVHLPNNAVFVDTRRTCKCRQKFYPIIPEQTKCMACIISKS